MNNPIVEPVGVLGIGVEGRATIDYLLRRGHQAITALDKNTVTGLPEGVETVFGPAHLERLDRFVTVFRSPGIRPDHPALAAARRAGCRVTSAVSCFLEQCPAPVIGITGTVGKGTAASLTAELLTAAGFTTHLGGNIGRSPLEFLDEVQPDHRVVLEISSFQAMDAVASPDIGVVLKTTSEHLDWHTDLDEYLTAKANLFAHHTQENTIIVNADADGSQKVAARSKGRRMGYSVSKPVEDGVSFIDNIFVYFKNGANTPLPIDPQSVRLTGGFNRENIAAALLAAHAAGAPFEKICAAATEFKGLPHRLEHVTDANGIRFFNDSYATRPEAAMGALNCFRDEPLSLILGGSEKYADFTELAAAVRAHPTLVYVGLIGATTDRLHQVLTETGDPEFLIERHDDLPDVVQAAHDALPSNGVVLLSPACASFGLFPNYKVRGEQFRALARQIANLG